MCSHVSMFGCAICLDPFDAAAESAEKVVVLKCGHAFHEKCLIKWLAETYGTCPTCRATVTDDSKRIRLYMHVINKNADSKHDGNDLQELRPTEEEFMEMSKEFHREEVARIVATAKCERIEEVLTHRIQIVQAKVDDMRKKTADMVKDLRKKNRQNKIDATKIRMLEDEIKQFQRAAGAPKSERRSKMVAKEMMHAYFTKKSTDKRTATVALMNPNAPKRNRSTVEAKDVLVVLDRFIPERKVEA